MKPIKMFGLAALAALMAMAFVGASSAMAEGSTSLCTADESPCASLNQVKQVHETSVGKGKLLAEGLPTVECTVLFSGETYQRLIVEGKEVKDFSTLGNPLIITGKFTYTACNNFCSVSEENGPAEIKVLRLGTELADVTGKGLVHVSCPFINCSYVGTGLVGHGLGALTSSSVNGNVVITKQLTVKETGGEICPEEAFLDLTTTPLVKTYISS